MDLFTDIVLNTSGFCRGLIYQAPLHKDSINRTPTGYKGGEEYFARKYSPDLLRRYERIQ